MNEPSDVDLSMQNKPGLDEVEALFSNIAAVRKCPFGVFERLRNMDGLYYSESIEAYVVARHDDIVAVSSDPECFSSQLPFGKVAARRDREILEPILAEDPSVKALIDALKPRRTPVLVNCDPPQHLRQRRLVYSWFAGARIREMEPMVREISADLITEFSAGGRVDMVTAFTTPFPVHVIASLLGASPDQREQFKRWSDDFMRAAGNHNLSKDVVIASMRGNVELYEFLRSQMDERRLRPQDDLITNIMNSRTAEDEPLSENELLAMFSQFLVAGNETTTALLGSALLVLARRQDLQSRLRDEPDKIPAFIEEVLRLESPAQGSFRVATRDTSIAGTEVQEGEQLFLLFASGSRDSSVYEFDDYDVDEKHPRHLAFNIGEHFCLGSALARLEGKVAIEQLLETFSQLTIGDVDIDYGASYLVRSLVSLPLQLQAASGRG